MGHRGRHVEVGSLVQRRHELFAQAREGMDEVGDDTGRSQPSLGRSPARGKPVKDDSGGRVEEVAEAEPHRGSEENDEGGDT